MDRIRIRGGARLNGAIPISGAKNAALKLMAASLLTPEPLTLTNVPRLADVRAMADLLRSFGVDVEVTRNASLTGGDTIRLHAANITSSFASYDMVRKMRASFQVLAMPLLARHGEAKVSLPGVAVPSARARQSSSRCSTKMARQGRAQRRLCDRQRQGRSKGRGDLRSTSVSVGATETAFMAATLARRTTVIGNAARGSSRSPIFVTA